MQNKTTDNIFACLSDIQISIIEIYDFLPRERNFLVFEKDLKTRKAIERNIEIRRFGVASIVCIKIDQQNIGCQN